MKNQIVNETNLNLVIGIATLTLSLVLTALTFLLIKTQRKKGYDEEKGRAEFEGIRLSLENQVYALNNRLIQNEERWRDVNHLLLRKEYLDNTSSITNSRKLYYSEFLKANGISENELQVNSRLVFVLTPFNDQFYQEFKTIKDVCSGLGFNCIRGDEKQFRGDIFPEMLRYIVQARIIIANINGRNPNVLYELGVAQALDKLVLLVSQEPKNLPIDIQSQRFLIYSDPNQLRELLRLELQKLI